MTSHTLWIRGRHPAVFRSGQWARVVDVRYISDDKLPARPCYFVRFTDGATDYWPVYDHVADYEFGSRRTVQAATPALAEPPAG